MSIPIWQRKLPETAREQPHLFEVKVVGAESKEQAVTLSKSIITSNLTKAAIFGHDANWGRILCAMGYSGAQFDPEKVDLYFESKAGKLQIIENGVATGLQRRGSDKDSFRKRSNSDCRCEDGRGDSYRMGLRSDL